MANKVERFDKNGNLVETYTYDERFSAVYALKLVWCYMHKVNLFDKSKRDVSLESFSFGESDVSFVFENDVFVCNKQKGRKDVYEGINGNKLDF